MVERALLAVLVTLALVAAASTVGSAITSTFAKINPQPHCAALAKDTCNGK